MRACVAVLGLLFLGAGAPSGDAKLRDALVGMSHDHMVMTAMRPARASDRARAAEIVAGAKAALARYPTVEAATSSGYIKYLPLASLPVEHYYHAARWNRELAGQVDPARPSSLLFERTAHGLKPIAVMYVASPRATEAQLDAVVPLSFAQWHRHVNLCFPAGDDVRAKVGDDPRFGFAGTLAGEASCHAAGGTWVPVYLGWMVHVWPNDPDPWGTMHHDEAPMQGMQH